MGKGNDPNCLTAMPAPVPVVRTVLYRSGVAHKVTYEGEVLERVGRADELRPDGRTGRATGLFCSADLNGLARWTRANISSRYAWQPTQLRYHGPEPYVYPVKLWTGAYNDRHMQEYWDAGMLLSDFLDARSRGDLDDWTWKDGHEVLVDPAFVTSCQPVSRKRLLAGADDPYLTGDLQHAFREAARRGIPSLPEPSGIT